MEIIIGREGNQQTKIEDKTVSRRHCKVTTNPDGTYTVENLSGAGTRIDGRDIVRATARKESIIQLGPVFKAQLGDLLVSKRILEEPARPEVPSFNISHLRNVWEDFNRTNIEKAEEQRKINLIRAGIGIFTMCTFPVAAFFGPLAFVLTAIGVAGSIYSFVGLKNSETPSARVARQDEFDDRWVCPNPKCNHTLLAKNYKRLVNDYRSCPFCQCKYVEK